VVEAWPTNNILSLLLFSNEFFSINSMLKDELEKKSIKKDQS
jgi:hypothetical protein